MIMIGAYAGLAAGVILAFFSHLAPRFGAGNYIQDIDQPEAFGKILTRREAHLIGIIVFLCTSLFFGALFAFGVEQGLVPGFSFFPVLGWSVLQFLFISLVVMPLEGHGWFGKKHDAWFPLDALITNIAWGLLFLGLSRFWLP